MTVALNRIKPSRDPRKVLVTLYEVFWSNILCYHTKYSDLYIDSVDEVDLANLFWALAQLLCRSGAFL